MPLAPILMRPAYRYGSQTPWGGAKLRELYNKDTPDARTGESLELSAIPGLNSTDLEGTPLSHLIERYGKALVGTDIKGDFPLLLKLLDARESLSVQVHPDDAYARKHENKLGKTEAWYILSAQPAKVEELLRYVPVTQGDCFFIPSGTVHAIGEGIVLYEIQQSSDVTYRFYDWERRDKNGNKRTLHLKQAIDVTNPDLRLDKVIPQPLPMQGKGQREGLLNTDFFETQRYLSCQDALIPADKRRFAVLTAITRTVNHWSCRPARQLCFPPTARICTSPAKNRSAAALR
jgi:mannose-6-phosphate isomerase